MAVLAFSALATLGSSACGQGSVGSGDLGELTEPPELTTWDPTAPPTAQDGQPLTSLRRLIRHFDFEEAELRPMEMPFFFHRVIASDRGFPPFGRMELRDDHAADGRWSLRFDLDGGSMAARVPTAVIPVLPFADYAVSVQVRTEGLRHAAARVVAQFHDQNGRLIPGSRVESKLIRTHGEWTTVSINMDGDFNTAADLVIELQLLQPGATEHHDADVPAIEDIHGAAWFDAINIWHLPRIDLTTGATGNICVQGDPVRLFARIIDMASEPLRAELWIYDLEGTLVHHALFDPPVEQTPQVIALPIMKCGWYRAIFDVHGRTSLVGRRWLDFAIVSEPVRVEPDERPLFTIDLADTSPDELSHVPPLLRQFGAPGVLVSPWLDSTSLSTAAHDHESIIQLTKALLDDRRSAAFYMRRLPDELAHALGLDPEQVIDIFDGPAADWQPYLEPILARFGLESPLWLIGTAAALSPTKEERLLRRAHAILSEYVPRPDVVLTPSASEAAAALTPTIWRTIPSSLRTEAMEQLLTRTGDTRVIVEMQTGASGYSNHQRLVDAMTRTLHAWRTAPQAIVHTPPWARSEQRRGEVMPTVEFVGLRTLIGQLSGRAFVAELDLGEDIHAWILKGEGSRSSALVAWQAASELSTADNAVEHSIALGGDEVTVSDAFSNRRMLTASAGRHRFTVGTLPVFIEGIDPYLALFRAHLQLDRPSLESAVRVQERELQMHNPWPVAITGSLRLRGDDSIEIHPRSFTFAIAPGATYVQPIECTLSRSILAGPARIMADVSIDADTRHTITTGVPIEIGLRNVRLTAQWLPAHDAGSGRRDLIISVHVFNDGDEPINLDAFAIGQGISQQRTTIGILAPGASTLRHFTIEDGLATLAGQTIRVGVLERDGPARLNTLLHMPPLGHLVIEPVGTSDRR